MALSLLFCHERFSCHEPYSAPFRAEGPSPLSGGEQLCTSTSALKKGVVSFSSSGKGGDSIDILHGISRPLLLSVNWDSRAAVPVLHGVCASLGTWGPLNYAAGEVP